MARSRRPAPSLPDQALFIRAEWIDKIFHHQKRWEVRGYQCHKRGEFGIAKCGANAIVGTFKIINCIAIGVKLNDVWWPVNGDRENFFEDPRNHEKTGFQELPKDFDAKCTKLWAWVLDDVVEFPQPVPWKPKTGQQIFATIANKCKGANPAKARKGPAPSSKRVMKKQ